MPTAYIRSVTTVPYDDMNAEAEAELAALARHGELLKIWVDSGPVVVDFVGADGTKYARAVSDTDRDPIVHPGAPFDLTDTSDVEPRRLSGVPGAERIDDPEHFESVASWRDSFDNEPLDLTLAHDDDPATTYIVGTMPDGTVIMTESSAVPVDETEVWLASDPGTRMTIEQLEDQLDGNGEMPEYLMEPERFQPNQTVDTATRPGWPDEWPLNTPLRFAVDVVGPLGRFTVPFLRVMQGPDGEWAWEDESRWHHTDGEPLEVDGGVTWVSDDRRYRTRAASPAEMAKWGLSEG